MDVCVAVPFPIGVEERYLKRGGIGRSEHRRKHVRALCGYFGGVAFGAGAFGAGALFYPGSGDGVVDPGGLFRGVLTMTPCGSAVLARGSLVTLELVTFGRGSGTYSL